MHLDVGKVDLTSCIHVFAVRPITCQDQPVCEEESSESNDAGMPLLVPTCERVVSSR